MKVRLLPALFLLLGVFFSLSANAQQNDRVEVFGGTPIPAIRFSLSIAVRGRETVSTDGKPRLHSSSCLTWERKSTSGADTVLPTATRIACAHIWLDHAFPRTFTESAFTDTLSLAS